MAGIGFELRRMLHGDRGITARLQALLTATMVTAGPWLITMLALVLVSVIGGAGLSPGENDVFRTLITYTFAASMVTVGAVQMPMTRYLADLLHDRNYDKILPAFVVATGCIGVCQTVIGIVFGYAVGLDDSEVLVTTALYVAVSLNWLAMAWLTVIREHARILGAFVVGLSTVVATTWLLGDRHGIFGPLAAYAAGQGLTFLLLAGLIGRALEHGSKCTMAIFGCVLKYPRLLAVGFCYSAGIWIDKAVFWWTDGVAIAPLLQHHPLYDSSCFLAYLTIIPALALNLIVLETRFYERYRRFYASLTQGQPLEEIEWQRAEMNETLREGAITLLRWQGLFTVLAICFAPQILAWLDMPDGILRTFRMACLGAFFQVFLLITILVLLYFDLQRRALIAAASFLILNGGLAWLTVTSGYATYGAGYAVAGFVSLAFAWLSLQQALPKLEYMALTRAALSR
tara:strand:+ start:34456 stop:35829 length:1374 start_codon:yes stop_codon:yes gene_type:complete